MSEKPESTTGHTFDDDSIRVEGQVYSCRSLGLEWPPPLNLHIVLGTNRLAGGIAVVDQPLPGTVLYRQVNRSQLSDDQRAEMTHVFRAADYKKADV